jgi:hypothetical protein
MKFAGYFIDEEGFIQTCIKCSSMWLIPLEAKSYGVCPHCGFDYDRLGELIGEELEKRRRHDKLHGRAN